jgi:purine-nucleoside phosphorylase
MTNFKTLFGIEPSLIQETCVIVPYLVPGLLKELGIQALKKGKLYATANTDTFTLIKAGIGVTLVGDAILYMEQTGCQEIIYFGACGLVRETDQLTIGSLACPKVCLSFESFTDTILRYTDKITAQYPDPMLFQSFFSNDLSQNIQPVIGMSIGSLKCEESYKELFDEEGIEVVDIECSAFFSAAQYIQKKAIALLYVTDIIGKKSLFEPLEPLDKLQIDHAIQTACDAIRSFCKNRLTTRERQDVKKLRC